MPLHPIFAEMMEVTREAGNPPVWRQSLTEIRKGPQLIKPLAGDVPLIPCIVNHMIHSPNGHLLLRFYYPIDHENCPLFLYFHPGFFVKGDIESHDTVCRSLAVASQCTVVSLNYSLAPEYPYPAALEDGRAAIAWLKKYPHKVRGDGRLAIGGENAGGNLAAVLAHETPGIDFQVLVYPQTDLTLSHPSCETYGNGYLLEKEALEWYIKQYIPQDIDRKDPRLSPLYAKCFDHLPKTLIITAQFDPLCDEGEAYAKKIEAAGVSTTLWRYPGMLHGFFQMGGVIEDGKQAIEEVGNILKRVFHEGK